MIKEIEKQMMIEIQEIYKRIDGEIYRFWKVTGEDNWRVEITPLMDVPYIEREFLN